MQLNLDNSYARLPGHFHASIVPDAVVTPTLLALNTALADELGFTGLTDAVAARLFSGAEQPAGSEPIAMAYAGHQFGYFVPQLGDGRAVLLGEALTPEGRRYDIQLKGSGRTPFSRGGDGKSWLGPVIREYVVSEAMYHLGVPTTRALAAVATGERVYREGALPGGVFTRVASSHLRIGTFEYFASRSDRDALETLTKYAIERHYPEAAEAEEPPIEFFRRVAEAQADLVAAWMAVGFIHGVMNTDNTAISGETLDYGPAAFMDEFRFDKVFSSIDRHGRYAYSNQPAIAQWNLSRLAGCLLAVGGAREAYEALLEGFPDIYQARYLDRMRAKLGLVGADDGDAGLIADWLTALEERGLDYTLSFRELAGRIDAEDDDRFGAVETRWRQRLRSQDSDLHSATDLMQSVNPLFIPRNHRVEQAISAAVDGDLSVFEDLNALLARPFDEQPQFAHYADAPEPSERVYQTFCGT